MIVNNTIFQYKNDADFKSFLACKKSNAEDHYAADLSVKVFTICMRYQSLFGKIIISNKLIMDWVDNAYTYPALHKAFKVLESIGLIERIYFDENKAHRKEIKLNTKLATKIIMADFNSKLYKDGTRYGIIRKIIRQSILMVNTEHKKSELIKSLVQSTVDSQIKLYQDKIAELNKYQDKINKQLVKYAKKYNNYSAKLEDDRRTFIIALKNKLSSYGLCRPSNKN